MILLPLAMVLPVSCSKDWDAERNTGDEKHCLTLKIVTDRPGTRAYNTADYGLSDVANRLDMYLFYTLDPAVNRHIVLTPDPSGTTEFKIWEAPGETVGFMVFANLHPDTAAYFEGKTLSEMSSESSGNKIIFSAGNFSPTSIPMVGATRVNFTDRDFSTSLDLYRVMSRIDLADLIVRFEDPELLGKEVWVKNIIIGNATNYMNGTMYTSFTSTGFHGYLFFGSNTSTLTGALGGVRRGVNYRKSSYDTYATKTISPGGTGLMAETYPGVLNNNHMKPAHTLTIDATGEMRNATVQTYDKSQGEGLIVEDGDMAASHTFHVNKSFYTFFGSVQTPDNIATSYYYQRCSQKLIIELEIDGESWYYPVQLTHTQPNTVYQLANITVTGLGSEYANFFLLLNSVDVSVAVRDWDEADIPNWNVGGSFLTGEPVGQN